MTPQRWTTQALLQWTTQRFEQLGLDNPRLAAEMLLAHALGVQRLKLYLEPGRPASTEERATFRALVERACKHEPVDYLTGQAPFMSMVFKVSPAVLVPRPSTEAIVEHVLQHARVAPGFDSPVIGDIGTGSGCIAVSLAKHLPDARVIATDISPDALAVAKANAEKHGVADRADFRQGDLLEPVQSMRFHYLISNPPYIPDDEWESVPDNVKQYEPTGALRGGADGLDFVRRLLEQGPALLHDPGQLLIELAASRMEEAVALAKANAKLTNVRVLADHERLPRVLLADRA